MPSVTCSDVRLILVVRDSGEGLVGLDDFVLRSCTCPSSSLTSSSILSGTRPRLPTPGRIVFCLATVSASPWTAAPAGPCNGKGFGAALDLLTANSGG
ncbi:hypothetical protein PC123_g25287 [Phytophthora cactorum]|nr:hypothetical protein PC120_g25321 [Phytophthora cactorum]KAG4039161.1 hypothetical protein PC123_g25287 [Phytophthora cactorum]